MNELGTWGVVFDPYVPPELGPIFEIGTCGCVTFGEGPPGAGFGNSNDVYVDQLTQIIYQKQGDTWVIVGSAKEIYSGNGDPTGVVTPSTDDAIYRQLDSVPAGLIWTWRGAGPWIAPET